MRRSIFHGDAMLFAAYERVGSIVNACAGLELAISYLEWQLVAFTWVAENPTTDATARQTALRVERTRRDKYASLSTRLRAVGVAFRAQAVADRIEQEPRLNDAQRDWERLAQRARSLGGQRDRVAHSTLAFTQGKVVRQIGRPWQEQTDVDEADDNELVRALGALTIEIGRFSTNLTPLLPFVDEDRYYTIA